MAYGFLEIAATPGVCAAQAANGSAGFWADFKGDRAFDRFTDVEAGFIAGRDSFYMATVSETGWPYVQHRGGAPGFLKLIDDRTLAFADYRGNRQYISIGNLATEDRTALILVDYPKRSRMKILAHIAIRALDDDPELTRAVLDTGSKAKAERIIVLTLETFDWNCPQHITPRFTQAEVEEAVKPLRSRLSELEQENAVLRSRLGLRAPP